MITAVVPTSPIPSHPETKILEETLDSIRHHLPDAEIVLSFDGVRPEQEDRRGDYEEYIRRALWLADHKYGNVCPLVFDQHMHQTGMMRAALAEIRTPLLLYVEHDTPLVTDRKIGFEGVANDLLHEWFPFSDYYKSGPAADLVRFHHEAVIPADHEHMMHGSEGSINIRTSQWSQRPHVATVAFYHRVMDQFSPDARCFIEDRMHGVCDEAFKRWGIEGWQQWRLSIYQPADSANLKFSYHIDGRAGGPKYEDAQVF